MRDELLPVVSRRLRERTGIDTFFYGNFAADEGGKGRAWRTYPHHPRFGSNYRGLTGRLDVLLETYSYIEFRERVRATYEFLVETLRFVAERAREVVSVVESSQRPPDRVAVRYRLEAFPEPVEIKTRDPYTLEGAPVSVTVPHYARFVGTHRVDRPFAYAVPEAAADHLRLHGLSLTRLDREAEALVEVARVKGAESGEARRILEAKAGGERALSALYTRERRALGAGTWLVPTEQPFGAVAVYLCEAESDDGLVACGVLPAPPPGAEFPVLRVLEPPAGAIG
jgi:hypothetical protein